MKRTLWVSLAAWLAVAASVGADVVVERWGVAGHVQHAKALEYVPVDKQATLMVLDVSAVPAGAKVYRARLAFFRRPEYARRFDLFPAQVQGEGKDLQVKRAGECLMLLPPYYRTFDATALVRGWVRDGSRKGHILIAGAPEFERDKTYLEIAYEGTLKDPPRQVTDLKTFYRAGQVFITFREIEDISKGIDDYPWGRLIQDARGYNPEMLIPKDEPREVRYRVYRHARPITRASIGEAELLAEVVPGSRFNTREVRRIWRGEQVPSVLDQEFIGLRLAVEPEKPLPSGVGKYVHTVTNAGTGYYAVVASVEGVENTADFSAANTAGPIEETVAPPEPVVYRKAVRDLEGKKGKYVQLWCNYYAAPPLSAIPMCYDVVVGFCEEKRARPAPVHVNRGHSWIETVEPAEPSLTAGIDLAHCSDYPNAFWMGINDAYGTLKGIEQGQWQPFPQRRQEALLKWLDRQYGIDWNQIAVGVGAWGMMEIERPDLYAQLHGWGLPEATKGFQAWQRACGVWGGPAHYKDRPNQESPFYRQDWTRYVLADPVREIPFFHMHLGWGAHFAEMGWPPVPRFLRAMIQTKRAFVYHWRAAQEERPTIRRDQSVPAFGNCSLDDNPGNGDLANGEGMNIQLNGYLTWDSQTLVDSPEGWEVTVWLTGRPPLPECTVDLTPRRCQKFKAAPGRKFTWTNTLLAASQKDKAGKAGEQPRAGSLVQSGAATADKWGLVTVEQLKVTTDKHRLVIRQAGK